MRTKRTKKIRQIVKSLAHLQKYSLVEIRRRLRRKGYKCISTEGGYKLVFRKKNEPVCVKVYRHPEGWKEDSYYVPPRIRKHFLYPVFKCHKFLIQEWVNCNYWDDEYQPKKKVPSRFYGWYDIREDNVGIRSDGQEVIVDFLS